MVSYDDFYTWTIENELTHAAHSTDGHDDLVVVNHDPVGYRRTSDVYDVLEPALDEVDAMQDLSQEYLENAMPDIDVSPIEQYTPINLPRAWAAYGAFDDDA